jgi:hypothetical protein
MITPRAGNRVCACTDDTERYHRSVRGPTAAFLFAATAVACGGKTTAPVQPLDGGSGAIVEDAGANDATTTTNHDAGAAGTEAGTDAFQCSRPLLDCGGTCIDPSDDRNNCGTCGAKCGTGLKCAQGACAIDCDGGLTLCGGACVSLQSDPANCGACDAGCTLGFYCAAGTCSTDCGGPGHVLCGNQCVDPRTDPNNCGQCGLACLPGELCVDGACTGPDAGSD